MSVEKQVLVYLHRSAFYILPSHRTTKGLWVASEPVLTAKETDESVLGALLLEALAQSIDNVPHPANWGALTAPLLKHARARSFESFADEAKCVFVSQEIKGVSFVPTKNGGRGNRFLFLSEKTIQSDLSEQDLTKSLRCAIALCE